MEKSSGKITERGIRAETYNMIMVGRYYSKTPFLDEGPDNVAYVISKDEKISFYLQTFDVIYDTWQSHGSCLLSYFEEQFRQRYPYELKID